MENINEYPALMAFWNQIQNSVAELRQLHPWLKTEKGLHYGEVLSDPYTRRLAAFAATKKTNARHNRLFQMETDLKLKKMLSIQATKRGISAPAAPPNGLCKGPIRARDTSHPQFVASQACLICGRTPSQAHHLKHAQLRAMGRKPGDQWTVPLCAIHHRNLHDHGNEVDWWPVNKIDPLKVAEGLWQRDH